MKTTGIALIAVERDEQAVKHGYDAAHDDTHDDGALIGAAINYAELARFISVYGRTDHETFNHGLPPIIGKWPHDWAWKPDYADAIKNLTIAGALIAAEIDRLLRANKAKTPA